MTKIEEGDRALNNFQSSRYVQDTQALQQYEDAQKIWPLLRYDTSFITRVNTLKADSAGIQSQPSVTIFLKDPFTNMNVATLTQNIQVLPGVTQVKYISKEDAVTIYKEQNKNNPQLLQFVTADILPASLEVYVSNQSIKTQIVTLAQSKSFVDVVSQSPN